MSARPTCTDPLDAALYEGLHRGTPGDVSHYLAECRDARDVLELGAGYGRISAALAGEGLRVTALELDPWLLARARAHRRELPTRVQARLATVRGDMTRFELGKRFDRVVIAHSTLYCVRSERELVSCLSCAFRHLRPGGVLLADAYAADGFHRRSLPVSGGNRLEPLVQMTLGRSTWQVAERSRWERDAQRFRVEYVCTRLGTRPRERVLRLHHRYFLAAQIRSAVSRAGFASLTLTGGFDGRRYDTRSSALVIRAARAQLLTRRADRDRRR